MTLVAGNSWPPKGADLMWQALESICTNGYSASMGAQAPLVHTAGDGPEEARQWGPFEFMAAFETPFRRVRRRAHGCSARTRVDFLVQNDRENPGAVTVFAIGPMTNIAMALRLRPDLETKIRQIVFMGGNVHVPGNVSRNTQR